jgi:cytochrome c-type biogenesis protein CcmH
MLAYQEGRPAEAVATWQTILAEVDPAGQEAVAIRQMIAEAQGRSATAEPAAGSGAGAPAPAAEGTASAPPSAAVDQPAAAGAGARIQVSVSLAPALSAKADPADTVFVFARAASGPPMPLAVQRIKVADLPATVTLDDSLAIVPSLRLSAFPQVVVGARVSKGGQAAPSPGDLEGLVGPLDLAATPTTAVTVDRIRP